MKIRVPATRIGDIVHGRRGITPDTALRLARFFGNSPEFWLNLQQMHDFSKTRLEHSRRIDARLKPSRARDDCICVHRVRQFASDAKEIQAMPQYVIERDIPGAGNLSPQELQAISQKSCGVLRNLGPQIQWEHSYVTGDKIYCIYSSPNEQMIRDHATQGGFPASRISEVKTIISPATAG